MVILSTPFNNFRKELLAKPKGLTVVDVLTKRGEYEALEASQVLCCDGHG